MTEATIKGPAKSVTFWGLLIMIVSAFGPVLAPMLGLEWDFSQEEIEDGVASIEQLAAAVGLVLGSIVAAWGRMRAKTRVTLTGK